MKNIFIIFLFFVIGFSLLSNAYAITPIDINQKSFEFNFLTHDDLNYSGTQYNVKLYDDLSIKNNFGDDEHFSQHHKEIPETHFVQLNDSLGISQNNSDDSKLIFTTYDDDRKLLLEKLNERKKQKLSFDLLNNLQHYLK